MTDDERHRAFFAALHATFEATGDAHAAHAAAHQAQALVKNPASLPVARRATRAAARLWAAITRVLRRRPRIVAYSVCRNGHVIPEPGSSWCDPCDSSRRTDLAHLSRSRTQNG